jgi:hypothetical protein
MKSSVRLSYPLFPSQARLPAHAIVVKADTTNTRLSHLAAGLNRAAGHGRFRIPCAGTKTAVKHLPALN